jgi:hypothetical protein
LQRCIDTLKYMSMHSTGYTSEVTFSYREYIRRALNDLSGHPLHVFEWDPSAHGVQVSSQLIALVGCRGLHMHEKIHDMTNETTLVTRVDRVN